VHRIIQRGAFARASPAVPSKLLDALVRSAEQLARVADTQSELIELLHSHRRCSPRSPSLNLKPLSFSLRTLDGAGGICR